MTVVNLCGIFSQDRTRLFPIAAVDKKMSEVSLVAFFCKDDDKPKDGLMLQ